MNLNKKFILLPALLLFFNAFAKDIYVSKDGDDSNSGTIDNPFLTITKAASVAVAGDIVYIRKGTYEETLTPLNSGTAGNPIIFQSFPGERVIISAMESLSGWTQESGAIYKTTIPFSSLGQENFVMHGETALDLARWPNKTEADPFALNTLRNTGGSGGSVINSAYLTESSIPGIDWTGGALWFYGDRPGSGWLAWKRTITSSSSGRVNFNFTTSNDWIRTFHPPVDKGDFFLEGVKGALDYQNEWYYDESTDELFVQLPSGSIPSDNAVKMRRRLLTINLKHKKHIEVKNLAVFGGIISLEDDTRWTTNSNTTNNVLYGITSLYGAHTQGVTNNFSTQIASVKIEGSNNRVEKCEIAFGAAGGLNVRGNNHLIKDNYIHDFDYLGSYDAPVVIRGINNTKVERNTVFNGGRDAIQYNGNSNEISFNDASRSNLIADDCALFYSVGRQPNTELHHNWFHDSASSGDKFKAAGIYLDTNPEGFTVHHNVVWNTEWTNIQMNWDAKDINIYNNTLWNGSEVMGAWHKEGTSFSNVKVWNNLGSDDNWEPQSDKQNNLVVNASVFEDEANGNFYLNNDSTPIDQGREISGITDGFLGSNPDIGAYENGGENWTPGISWTPELGPAGLGCYGLPGENCLLLPENDQDNDGVDDSVDQCPNTPAGSTVNTVGCQVFTLPADNFTILTSSETCSSSNNGSVQINSKENAHTFIAKIEGTSTEKTFTESTVFDNLNAGDYTICITTPTDAEYEQCFTLTITEPEDLSVFTKVDNASKTMSLTLNGGHLYRINLNGFITVTDQNSITLQLKKGTNDLTVSTDKDCQGQHKQEIVIFDEITIFPTVVEDEFIIGFPEKKDQKVVYQILSSTGQTVIQKSVDRKNQQLAIDVTNLSTGIYFVNVMTSSSNVNFKSKIIKK